MTFGRRNVLTKSVLCVCSTGTHTGVHKRSSNYVPNNNVQITTPDFYMVPDMVTEPCNITEVLKDSELPAIKLCSK